jgi:hypothetical protein
MSSVLSRLRLNTATVNTTNLVIKDTTEAITLQAPPLAQSYTLTLPVDAGQTGNFLLAGSPSTWSNTVPNNVFGPNFINASVEYTGASAILDSNSPGTIILSGAAGKDINLPVATSLTVGRTITFVNSTNGMINIRVSGGGLIVSTWSDKFVLVCIDNTVDAGTSWNYSNSMLLSSLVAVNGPYNLITGVDMPLLAGTAINNRITNGKSITMDLVSGEITIHASGCYNVAFSYFITTGAGTLRVFLGANPGYAYSNQLLYNNYTIGGGGLFTTAGTFVFPAGQVLSPTIVQDSGSTMQMYTAYCTITKTSEY